MNDSDIIERLVRIEEMLKSREELCSIHRAEIVGLKKDIDGNGKPGVKAELQSLKNEFIKFETKVLTYATIGASVGGIVVTIFVKKLIN
jgi:hypothetical protein